MPITALILTVLVEFGVFGTDAGPTVGSALFAGSELGRGEWRTEIGANLAAEQFVEKEAAAGRVSFAAVGAGAAARLRRRAGAVWLGFEGGLSARLIDAEALAPDGRTGSAWRAIPAAMLGLEIRVPLHPAIALRAAAGLEVAFLRRRFTIEDQAVVDLGRLRGLGFLALVCALSE